MLKEFLRRPGVKALGAAWLGGYLRFALRTTRWHIEGRDTLLRLATTQPVIAAFWHERLPMAAQFWVEARANGATNRTHILASRHHDGRFIGDVMRAFHVEVIHGSTTRDGRDRGGAAGLRALLGVLAQGDNAVITPDGPRGPRRVATAGVAQLAALAQVV